MEDGDRTTDEGLESDEVEEKEEGGGEEEEEEEYPSPYRKQPQRKKCCPTQRIDELATPNKRMFLALWNEHAHHLPKDKVENLKQLLQQLYAMSPEETAKYFEEIRAEARAAEMRRKLKQKLRRYLVQKYHQRQRERAYKLLKRLLKCGIAYAAENPVPPVVSLRLRYLSDVILEQLCDLRKVVAPNRSNPGKLGLFLIAVADWMALAVERLYYAAQLSINELINRSEKSMEVPTNERRGQSAGAPASQHVVVNETGRKSLTVPDTYEDFGQPMGASTPHRLSVDETKRLSLDPFHSYMMASTVKIADKTQKTIVPNYTFDHMTANMKVSATVVKSKLEIPFSTATDKSTNKSRQTYTKENSMVKKRSKTGKFAKSKSKTRVV